MLKCNRCGFEWEANNDMEIITCPSCLGEVKNPNCKKREKKK